MARIVRRESPPNYGSKYRKARLYLRRDFARRCAYCMTHDEEIGPSFFVIDHYLPRANGGTDEYTNLYYSCLVCNARKHDTWPSDVERICGLGFCDPCAEWDYGEHFVENDQWALERLTQKGDYHIGQIDLNRSELVEKRRRRDELLRLMLDVKEQLAEGHVPADRAKRIRDNLERIEKTAALAIPRLPRR